MMKPSINSTVAVATLLTIAACGAAENPATSGRVAAIHAELDSLKMALRLAEFRLDLVALPRYETATFDPVASQGYSRIDSNVGPFLVSMNNIQSYGDGVRVAIEIGNLNSATYSGGRLAVTWGPRVPDFRGPETDSYADWQRKLRQDTISFTDVILPGAWNRVSFVLPGTNMADFGHIEIGISVDRLSLRRR
jgi:hypothetical protein